MKKLYFLIVLFFSILSVLPVQAGFLSQNVTGQLTNNTGLVQREAGYDSSATIGTIVGAAIKGFLGLLGIIFVILIIIAGYNWMSAAGDEEKITKAKDTLRAAVIGIIIVVAAYAITYFVFSNLPGAGGANPPVNQ